MIIYPKKTYFRTFKDTHTETGFPGSADRVISVRLEISSKLVSLSKGLNEVLSEIHITSRWVMFDVAVQPQTDDSKKRMEAFYFLSLSFQKVSVNLLNPFPWCNEAWNGFTGFGYLLYDKVNKA